MGASEMLSCDAHGPYLSDWESCPACQVDNRNHLVASSPVHLGRDTLFPWPVRLIFICLVAFNLGVLAVNLYLRFMG